MRIAAVAITIVTASALCSAAQARHYHRVNHLVRVPVVSIATRDPTWPVDYNIVPRYRYRPQDDRVDPYGPPVAPGDIEPGGPGPSGW
jgi:hypothetical protein